MLLYKATGALFSKRLSLRAGSLEGYGIAIRTWKFDNILYVLLKVTAIILLLSKAKKRMFVFGRRLRDEVWNGNLYYEFLQFPEYTYPNTLFIVISSSYHSAYLI